MVQARSDFWRSVDSLLHIVSSDGGAPHIFSMGRSLVSIAQRWPFRYTCSSPIMMAWVNHCLLLVKFSWLISLLSPVMGDFVGSELSVEFCGSMCYCRYCPELVSGKCCPYLGNRQCTCIRIFLIHAAGGYLDAQSS